MNDTAIVTTRAIDAAVLEKVTIQGDLSSLVPAERVDYYRRVCESLGLNPFTKPFDYITLNGKLTLYAKRDATDQLRKINHVSLIIASRETIGDVYVVTARATTPDGRQDESTGAVSIKGLAGDALANALMKAETKAKRRVTLSIVGLGWLDETETTSIPSARAVMVDMETGEIVPGLASQQSENRQPAAPINQETVEPDEPESAPTDAKSENGNGPRYAPKKGESIPQAWVSAGISNSVAAAASVLSKHVPNAIRQDPIKAMDWGYQYRDFRNAGMEVDEAAAATNEAH